MIKTEDRVLRIIAEHAAELPVAHVTCNTGYYVLAIDDETEVTVCVNKQEDDKKYFGLHLVCNSITEEESFWTDWEYTETQDEQELYGKLKEIRDNLPEEDLKGR